MEIFNRNDELPFIEDKKIMDEFEFERRTVKTGKSAISSTKMKMTGFLSCLVSLIVAIIGINAYNKSGKESDFQFNNYGTVVINQQANNNPKTEQLLPAKRSKNALQQKKSKRKR
jgi:hypothetical protein